MMQRGIDDSEAVAPRQGINALATQPTAAPAAPATPLVDVYGKGNRLADGTLKSNNQALSSALDTAYQQFTDAKNNANSSGDNEYAWLNVNEKPYIEAAFKQAGVDPKLIPARADLDAYKNILQYNGVGADPLRALQETQRYEDGRTTNEANTRDFIAKGLANGQTHDEIWKNIQGYNDQHSGGWAKENLGVSGEDLAKAAAVAAAIYTGGASLGALGGGAGAGSASGLAGMLGMNAGLGATALNAGALNAGMTGLRGGNIGDMIKSGATGALLSPVSSLASGAVGGGALGTVVGNTASGGAGALLTGKDLGTGLRNGLVNGVVSAGGTALGDYVKGAASGIKDALPPGAASVVDAASKGYDMYKDAEKVTDTIGRVQDAINSRNRPAPAVRPRAAASANKISNLSPAQLALVQNLKRKA